MLIDDPAAPARRKAALRTEARSRRDRFAADDRGRASRAIEARLAALPELRAAEVVHCYIGIGSEVATEELIRALFQRGQRVVAPRVAPGGVLEHLEMTDLDALVPGPMGLREPNAATAPRVELREVDVMLVPGLAFDATGYRLGYGGGYYDRAITALSAHHHATTVGLAFEAQLVDDVPREEHDQPVHLIVTETRTIVTGAP
jgi:5-formyltetrahydrofolate cyclo-ligase